MITTLCGMFIWALLHSLAAGKPAKQFARRRLGDRAYDGLYRLGYNLFAAISILPVVGLIYLQHGEIVWTLPNQWLPISLTIQAVGLAGLIMALLQTDLGRFSGFSQLRAYLSGNPLPQERLRTGGLYALVRHPLYLFSLMVIWPFPVMTESVLAFNIVATLYFVVGSRLEERRLVAAFGQEYVEYRRRVPWLLPWPRLRRGVSHQFLG